MTTEYEYRDLIPALNTTSALANGASFTTNDSRGTWTLTNTLSDNTSLLSASGFDKNPNTLLRTATGTVANTYVEVTFPNEFTVGKYKLEMGRTSVTWGNMASWEIVLRINGQWTTVHTGTSSQAIVSLEYEFEPVKADGVRILCTAKYSTNSWGFDEFYLFESKPSAKSLIYNEGFYKKLLPGESSAKEGNAVPMMQSHIQDGFEITSSSEQPSFPSWRVFDGVRNSSTSWLTVSGLNTNQYLQVKLNRKRKVYKYKVTNRGGGGSGYATHAPKNFQLLGSDNGSDWDIVSDVTEQTGWGDGETREFTIDIPSDYLYYRLFIIDNNGGVVIAVGELELLAEKIKTKNSQWIDLYSTKPTKEQFVSEGMNSLSPLLDRRIQEVTLGYMNDVSVDLNGEVGKKFSKVLNLTEYVDIRTIKVEVE